MGDREDTPTAAEHLALAAKLTGLLGDRPEGAPALEEESLWCLLELAVERLSHNQELQELLTNIAKHAGAQRISVVVESGEGGVRMIVKDDGVGFDPETEDGADQVGGLGLAGIRERLMLLDGLLTIESTPGGGSSLYVDIPVARP